MFSNICSNFDYCPKFAEPFPSWDPWDWRLFFLLDPEDLWLKVASLGFHRMGFFWVMNHDPKFWSLKSHFPHPNEQTEKCGDQCIIQGSFKRLQMTPKQKPFCFTLQVTIRSTPKAASMKLATKVRHGLNFTCSKLQMTSVDVSLWASWWLRFQPIWKICNRQNGNLP